MKVQAKINAVVTNGYKVAVGNGIKYFDAKTAGSPADALKLAEAYLLKEQLDTPIIANEVVLATAADEIGRFDQSLKCNGSLLKALIGSEVEKGMEVEIDCADVVFSDSQGKYIEATGIKSAELRAGVRGRSVR